MSHISVLVLMALTSLLASMLVFIVGRRAWRALIFRRLDRFQEHWLRQLPGLLAGGTPQSADLRSPQAREVLETLLLRRLQTSEAAVRKQALELFERSGLLDRCFEFVRHGSRWQRLRSVAVLGKIGSAVAVPALVEALGARNALVRIAALRGLGAIGSAVAAPALVRFLRRERRVQPGIWLEAAVACVTDPKEFLPLLEDDRPEIRALGAQAIAEYRGEVPLEPLEALVFDSDPEVRAQIVRALANNKAPRTLGLLMAATQDEVWFVRLRALSAIGKLKAASALDIAMRATGDENFKVRQQAAATLASLATHEDEIVQALVRRHDRYGLESYLSQLAKRGLLWRTLPLLCSKQDALRRAAEALLSDAIRAGYFQETKYAAETDPDWGVRLAAARLLARCGHPLGAQEEQQPVGTATVHAHTG